MPSDITQILLDARKPEDAGATERLVEALYPELHRLAQGLMRRERPGHTLQPTALVGEGAAANAITHATSGLNEAGVAGWYAFADATRPLADAAAGGYLIAPPASGVPGVLAKATSVVGRTVGTAAGTAIRALTVITRIARRRPSAL